MKSDVRLTEEIKSLVIKQGADLVGIAPVERFLNAPKGYGPQDYMPDSKCVISLSICISDGVCDVWGEYTKPGKSIGPYLFYGYGLINLELGRIADLCAKALEFKGYKSLTFPPTWQIALYRNRGFSDEKLMSDFSHRHTAVAAGLGEFGWNGLVLTPYFGARIRLNSIITNAPLVPSPMYSGPALCLPERCNYLCQTICPAKAFSEKETEKVVIEEKTYTYATKDKIRCRYGVMGLVKGSGCYEGIDIPAGPSRLEHLREASQNRHPDDKAIFESARGIICGDHCGLCLLKCPAHIYNRKV